MTEETQKSYKELIEISKTIRINRFITALDKKLRQQYPILNAQNFIGFSIFIISALGMILSAWLYFSGLIPWYVCFLVNAFLASLLHELEHDLIHFLYFPRNKFMQNLMMLGVWMFRGNIVNPWYRRELHLIHHRKSGTKDDVEEQLIGNGMPLGIKRILLTLDPLLSTLRLTEIKKYTKNLSIEKFFLATFPMVLIFNVVWWIFLTNLVFHYLGEQTSSWIKLLTICYVGPNILRQASLSLISSNCHYFGDLINGNVSQQTQVLQNWFLSPFQLFCFNFGGTHIIHHFFVPQPFYLRQMVSGQVHELFKKCQIRFNDFGNILRGNRYQTI